MSCSLMIRIPFFFLDPYPGCQKVPGPLAIEKAVNHTVYTYFPVVNENLELVNQPNIWAAKRLTNIAPINRKQMVLELNNIAP